MVNEKTRDSNFELLRIFSIITIIISHITMHVLYKQFSPDYIYGPGEMFNNIYFYRRLILIDFFFNVGKVGNVLFILITGYFLCGNKSININKTIKKLLSHMLFATLVLIWASIIIQYFKSDFTHLPSLFLFNDEWWFIGYYFIIILVGNYFINKRIDKIDKNKYISILLILFVIISISYCRETLEGITPSLSKITMGIFFYLLGGFIKKYNPLKNISSLKLVLSELIIMVIAAVSYRNTCLSRMNEALINNSSEFYQKFIHYEEYSLIIVISAIILFELFKRMKIKSKIINFIGESTFMIYLLHDNPYIRSMIGKINLINDLHDDILKFMFFYIALIVIIFIITEIIYLVYKRIMDYLKMIV